MKASDLNKVTEEHINDFEDNKIVLVTDKEYLDIEVEHFKNALVLVGTKEDESQTLITKLQKEKEDLQQQNRGYEKACQAMGKQQEIYKEAFYALYQITLESEADVVTDIITDIMSGFELDEKYKELSKSGEQILNDYLYRSDKQKDGQDD